MLVHVHRPVHSVFHTSNLQWRLARARWWVRPHGTRHGFANKWCKYHSGSVILANGNHPDIRIVSLFQEPNICLQGRGLSKTIRNSDKTVRWARHKKPSSYKQKRNKDQAVLNTGFDETLAEVEMDLPGASVTANCHSAWLDCLRTKAGFTIYTLLVFCFVT